jgi:hypothetical protein
MTNLPRFSIYSERGFFIMNRRLIGADVLKHPIIKRLLESRMLTTSEVVRVIAEELSTEEVNAFLDAAKADPKKGATKAYRNLSRKYHPDRNKDNPEAEAAFKQTMNLRDILSGDKPDMIKDELTVKALKAAGYSDQQIQSFQGSGKIDLQVEPGQETGDKTAAGQEDIDASKEEVVSAKKFQEQLKSVYDAFEAVLKKYADNAEGLYSIEAVKELVPVLKENMLTEQDEDVEKLITDDATESIKRIAKALNDLKGEINKEVQEIMKATQEETAVAVTEERGSGAFLKPKEFKDWYSKNIKGKFPGANLGKILQVLKKELADVGIGYGTLLKEYLDKNDLMKALVDAGAIPDNQTAPQLTGQIVIFLKSMAQKHKWPDPKKPEEATPKSVALTVQQKSAPLAVLMQGELAPQQHQQLVKASQVYGNLYKKIERWVKIYGLLARFINSGTKKLTGQEDPQQQNIISQAQQIQIPLTPDPPPPEPIPEPEPEPEPTPEPEPEEEEEDDEGPFVPVVEFNKHFNALEPEYERFENRFLKTPFLGTAAKIYNGLYDGLLQFDKNVREGEQAAKTTQAIADEPSPATAQPAAKRDDLYEQDTGLGENIRSQLMQILKELRPLVTQAVDSIDEYFKTVKTQPTGDEDERSVTIGGGVIERKINGLMDSIQLNLGELHELVSRLDAEKGDYYSLKEQQQEEEEEAPAKDDLAFKDTEKGKRRRRNKVSQKEQIDMTRSVYRQVISNLVEFIAAVDGLGDIDSVNYGEMRPLIKDSIDQLNTIRNFFPSMAPFGKAKDPKEKREIRRQAKNLGRRLNDIVDRLNRVVRQKATDRRQRQQMKEQKENVDKATLNELKEVVEAASKTIQDAFGVDSQIGKVIAQKREIKDTDAAPTPAGEKAVKDGKATTPEEPSAPEDKSKAAFNEVGNPSQAITAFRDLKSVIQARMPVVKKLAPNSAWKNDPIYTYIFYVFLKNDFESVVSEEEKISGLSKTTMDQLGLNPDKVRFLNNVIAPKAMKVDKEKKPINPDLFFFYTGANKILKDPKRRTMFMEQVIEPLDDRIKKQQRKFILNAQDLRIFIMKAVDMRDEAETELNTGTANENLEIKITNKLIPIIERMLNG